MTMQTNKAERRRSTFSFRFSNKGGFSRLLLKVCVDLLGRRKVVKLKLLFILRESLLQPFAQPQRGCYEQHNVDKLNRSLYEAGQIISYIRYYQDHQRFAHPCSDEEGAYRHLHGTSRHIDHDKGADGEDAEQKDKAERIAPRPSEAALYFGTVGPALHISGAGQLAYGKESQHAAADEPDPRV